MKIWHKIFYICLLILFSIAGGYILRMHHENYVRERDASQAEKDLDALENEFSDAWDKPRSFHIFQGQFRIWPVKAVRKSFYYEREGKQ